MITQKLLTIFLIFAILGCKSSSEKSEEIKNEKADTPVIRANGRSEFYRQLENVKLTKPYKAKGDVISNIRDLFSREEMASLNISRIQFRYLNISKADFADYQISHEVPNIELNLIEGVPASIVMQQIETQALWHVEDFTDGILTINCWSKPDVDEDYNEKK